MAASANKAGIVDFYESVLAGGDLSRLDELVAESYTPHCAPLADVARLEWGRDALRRRLVRLRPVPHQLYRVIGDGDQVCAHVRYEGAVPISAADLFRFDAEGRIAEHWNSRQRIPDDAARDVDRFAGGGNADLPTSEARRAEMKAVMAEVLREVWGNGRGELVPHFYSPAYVQHNPDMPGGADRIREVVETEIKAYLQATGGPFPIELHQIGAEGDLIFVRYSVFMAGIGRKAGARSTNLDIFRIASDNRMIEHWDVLQIEGEPLPDDRSLF